MRIYYLLLFLMLFSCRKEKITIASQKGNTRINSETEFLSVYSLSKKTTAIVINIKDTPKQTKFDRIFDKVDIQDSLSKAIYDWEDKSKKNFSYFDTLGQFRLLKSEKLQSEIKKIIKSEYFIYGTKGFEKASIKEVLFSIDECRTNFIACTFEKFDTGNNTFSVFRLITFAP